ncbi:MAG: DUF4430 domain-containing protein [Candidatus Bathyarchaeota archaeon]|nr:DUF4430 domain-containing protein [Candidatus Termiticorpusculum sp.]
MKNKLFKFLPLFFVMALFMTLLPVSVFAIDDDPLGRLGIIVVHENITSLDEVGATHGGNGGTYLFPTYTNTGVVNYFKDGTSSGTSYVVYYITNYDAVVTATGREIVKVIVNEYEIDANLISATGFSVGSADVASIVSGSLRLYHVSGQFYYEISPSGEIPGVTVSGDLTVTFVWTVGEQADYNLTVISSNEQLGSVFSSFVKNTESGSEYLITAVSDVIGYNFGYWEYALVEGQLVGDWLIDDGHTSATAVIVVEADIWYRANFRPTVITQYKDEASLIPFPRSYMASDADYMLYAYDFSSTVTSIVSTPTFVGDPAALYLPIFTVDGSLSAQVSYWLYFGDATDPTLSGTTIPRTGQNDDVFYLAFGVRYMPEVSSVRLVATVQDVSENELTIEHTYAVAPQKLGITDPITVYMSVEKLTVHEKIGSGSYYLVEPQAFTIDSSWNVARATGELLKSHGLEFTNTGSLDAGFYLSGVWDSEANSGAGGYLSEFSYGSSSGWMYSVNHYFPGSGSAEYPLLDGDVIRWQYTCEGLGEDLGASWGVFSTFADKTMLMSKYAQLAAAGSTSPNLSYALSVLQKLNPLQAEVDAAYFLLNAGGQVEANKGALNNAISEATAFKNAVTGIVGNDKGMYPQTAYNVFVSAINAATAVRSDTSATQTTVDNAIVTLKDAIAVFAKSKNYFTSSDFNDVSDLVLAKVGQTTNPIVASVGGEWTVIALARGGQMTDTIKNVYLTNLDAVLSGKPTGPVRLDLNKPTENQRVTLALTSLGFDASDYKGYDFVSPLMDVSWVKSQGINSVTFALIALDSKPYTVEGGVREALVAELLAIDFSDFDVDYVAMALQALAPYYAKDDAVKTVVDDALLWLSSVQNDDGDFGSFSTQNSESTVQVLVALSALDSDDVVGKLAVLNGLFRYALPDGSFQHVLTSGSDMMATEQGAYALVAYNRFLNGLNSLYDMSDAFGDVTDPSLGDNEAIVAAKVAIENAFADAVVVQAEADSEVVALAKINAILNGVSLNGVTAVVSKISYTVALAGTSENPFGTNGSYTFTVALTKGVGAEQVTETLTLTILATPFELPVEPDEFVEVVVSIQLDDTGLCLAKQPLVVEAGLSERYGYVDAYNGEKVTVLDALVAAHILMFGDENLANYLKIDSSGLVTRLAGKVAPRDAIFSFFFVNGALQGNSAVTDVIVVDGDDLLFYLLQDMDWWFDSAAWFADGSNGVVDSITIGVGEEFSVKLVGYIALPTTYGWDPEDLTEPIGGAQVVVLDFDDSAGFRSAWFSAGLGLTDATGQLSITFNTPGTYVLSAYDTTGWMPFTAPWLVVTVTEKTVLPVDPVVVRTVGELQDALNDPDVTNVIIPSDVTLELVCSVGVDLGVTLTVQGTLVIADVGVVNNAGVICNAGGTICNIGGTINNYAGGIIQNCVDGLISISDAGMINNYQAVINNDGVISNVDGIINNNAATINNNGGIVNNYVMGVVNNYVEGVINSYNFGVICSSGVINNNAAVINNFDAAVFTNDGGMINNNAAIIINDDGVINNNGMGMVNNYAGGVICNSGVVGVFNNNDQAILNNGAIVFNVEGAVINNVIGALINNAGDGIINNNAATIINDGGVINNYGAGTINNNAEGVICNSGVTGVINNYQATINNNNEAIINNDDGAMINNNAASINNNSGTINNDNEGMFNNYGAGEILNYNTGVINNYLAIINNGAVIDNRGGGTINSDAGGAVYTNEFGVIYNDEL